MFFNHYHHYYDYCFRFIIVIIDIVLVLVNTIVIVFWFLLLLSLLLLCFIIINIILTVIFILNYCYKMLDLTKIYQEYQGQPRCTGIVGSGAGASMCVPGVSVGLEHEECRAVGGVFHSIPAP